MKICGCNLEVSFVIGGCAVNMAYCRRLAYVGFLCRVQEQKRQFRNGTMMKIRQVTPMLPCVA